MQASLTLGHEVQYVYHSTNRATSLRNGHKSVASFRVLMTARNGQASSVREESRESDGGRKPKMQAICVLMRPEFSLDGYRKPPST